MIRLINKHKWLLAMFAVVLVVMAGCNGPNEEANPLELALANGKPTLVEFGRGMCIACQEMKPILDGLAGEYKGKLNVVIIDIDDFMALTTEYGVTLIPTQIIFNSNGDKVDSHIGFWSKEEILTKLKAVGIG